MYDFETGDIGVSRDVIFHEDVFPFAAEVAKKENLINFGREESVYLEDDFFDFGQRLMGEGTGSNHQPSGSGDLPSPATRPLHEQTGSHEPEISMGQGRLANRGSSEPT